MIHPEDLPRIRAEQQRKSGLGPKSDDADWWEPMPHLRLEDYSDEIRRAERDAEDDPDRWPSGWYIGPLLLVWLLGLVIAVGAFLSPAKAQEVTWQYHEGESPFLTIQLRNAMTYGTGDEVLTIETPYGPLTIVHDRTPNSRCNPECPDSIEVVDWPQGVVARPWRLDVPERDSGVIQVFRWNGG